MSRKTASFGQLLNYINHPKEKGLFGFTHNMFASRSNLLGMREEFQDNAKFLPKRKNGVVLYHEIISFHELDVTEAPTLMMADLAQKYFELRAPNGLGYARAHFDKPHPHLHILLSGNVVGGEQKTRVSKGKFQRIKIEMEQYVRDRYPELIHSRVEHGQGKRTGRGEGEWRRRLKAEGKKEPSKKEAVREQVTVALAAATSLDSFRRGLSKGSFSFYTRGKTCGVTGKDGRKYRLTTLQVDIEGALRRWGETRIVRVGKVRMATGLRARGVVGVGLEVGDAFSVGRERGVEE